LVRRAIAASRQRRRPGGGGIDQRATIMGIQGMTHARMVRSNAKHAEMSRDFFSFAVDPWLRRLIRQKPRRSRVARNAGNKATTREHDFLSLYTTAAKDPSLQLHDAKPPPPSQGLKKKTLQFCLLISRRNSALSRLSSSSSELAVAWAVGRSVRSCRIWKFR
jgi:hypothetical protein